MKTVPYTRALITYEILKLFTRNGWEKVTAHRLTIIMHLALYHIDGRKTVHKVELTDALSKDMPETQRPVFTSAVCSLVNQGILVRDEADPKQISIHPEILKELRILIDH